MGRALRARTHNARGARRAPRGGAQRLKRTLVEEGECLLELRDLLLGKFLSHFEVEKEWKEMVRGEERGKRDEQSKRAATGLVTSRDEAAIFLFSSSCKK